MFVHEWENLLGNTKSGISAKFETRLIEKPVGAPGALFWFISYLYLYWISEQNQTITYVRYAFL